MTDFAAIDFETANSERTSVCAVGVVIVRDNTISGKFYSLIKPEPNYYNYWCRRVHGLGPEDTDTAPVFPDVWRQIRPLITGLPLVAHNKAFDETCLRAVMRCYGIDWPDLMFYCTLQASRRAMPELPDHRLDTVAAAIGHPMSNHHNALADAEAAAHIAIELM